MLSSQGQTSREAPSNDSATGAGRSELSRPASDDKPNGNSSPPPRRRDYDLCMVFTHSGGSQDSRKADVSKSSMEKQMEKQQRETVIKNLQNCGLHIFCHYSRDRDEIFCKIGATAQQLRNTAARLKYKLQLKPEYLNAYAEYRNDFPGRPEHHYSDRRLVAHIYKSHTHEDYPGEDAIFSTRDKIFLINHIITSRDRDCAGVNVGNLVHNKELKAYFPLHEERALHDLGSHKLAFVWMEPQHADRVRDYFGEKIAFYFLFMSFYWKTLLVPAALGIFFQLVDWGYHTPNNWTAAPFCIFMSVWTSLMPHFWRRQEAKFAIAFGTLDMVPEFEPARPQFYGENRMNPVTAQIEPYYSWRERLMSHIFSVLVIMVGFVLLVAYVMAILFLRHGMKDQLPDHSQRIIIFNFAIAILVEMLNGMLATVAKKLNDWENHRTQTEYERHLLIKTMAFKFVNCYFVLYYIAFVKSGVNFLGVQMTCWRDDCFMELQLQLAAFIIVRMTLSNLAEYLVPKLLSCGRGISDRKRTVFHNMVSYNKLELADMSAQEAESKKENYSSFEDFDEVLIGHGYATLFAVTSPWVCTATLLWVIVESILDVKGITEVRRRPLPERVRTNEPWNTAFDIYGTLGVFTNITLLVWTSDIWKDQSSTYRLVVYIYLLHAVFLSKWVVQALFPERPRSVELLRLKQAFVVHRCLENIKLDAQQQTHQDYGLLRSSHKSERIPVLDQDMNDLDAEEEEPHFHFLSSMYHLYTGLKESIEPLWCCAFLIAISATIALSVFLVLYNLKNGNALPQVHKE